MNKLKLIFIVQMAETIISAVKLQKRMLDKKVSSTNESGTKENEDKNMRAIQMR